MLPYAAYSTIQILMPYGPLYPIPKDECVSHVTKRMGTNQRELIRVNKGKKLSDGKGLGGKGGGLTITRIDAIQNFYGKSIRENKGDAAVMSKAAWAILDHYSSKKRYPAMKIVRQGGFVVLLPTKHC